MGSSPIGHPSFPRSASPRKWQPPRLEGAGTPGAACAALVDAALAQIAANVGGALEGRNPEYLHQLRVGIRRLRVVLRIFRKTTGARKLDRRLRRLVVPLGEARDWDVFVERYPSAKAEQRAAQAVARALLASPEWRAVLAAAQRWGAAHAGSGRPPLRRFAAKALDRQHRSALKRARHVDWRDEPQRHKVRIAVRRLRYAGDFFAACFDEREARRYVHALARLQDLLGELNDIAVARRLAGQLGGREAKGTAARERALLASLKPAWRAFAKRPCFWRAAT